MPSGVSATPWGERLRALPPALALQAGFRPAELRIQPHSLQWLLLHSTLALPSSPPLTLSHSTDHTHLLSTIKVSTCPQHQCPPGCCLTSDPSGSCAAMAGCSSGCLCGGEGETV